MYHLLISKLFSLYKRDVTFTHPSQLNVGFRNQTNPNLACIRQKIYSKVINSFHSLFGLVFSECRKNVLYLVFCDNLCVLSFSVELHVTVLSHWSASQFACRTTPGNISNPCQSANCAQLHVLTNGGRRNVANLVTLSLLFIGTG